jgi:hypothetical protein
VTPPTVEETIKWRILEELERYKSNPDDAAHAITWLLCREVYARGFIKGHEGGKAFPSDPGTFEDGHWFAAYAFAEPDALTAERFAKQ